LATKDHFSSNWTSRVRGGKSHELVVDLVRVATGQPAVAHYRVAVHLHEPFGLADAAPLGQVLQDRDGLVLGETRLIKGGPLPFGEATTARAAFQDPILLSHTATAMNAEVQTTPSAVILTRGVEAAETGEIVHDKFRSCKAAATQSTRHNAVTYNRGKPFGKLLWDTTKMTEA
jgi:hypothetical protein